MKNCFKETILGQPSFIMRSDCVELAVTEFGGNMAPVTFGTNTENPQMPYFFNPWQMEGLAKSNDYMDVFRGDFLCLPFGKRGTSPMHGETCGRKWDFLSCEKENGKTVMALSLDMKDPEAKVKKYLTLADGQNAVYIRHEISELDGYFSYAHHCTLAINSEREGIISHSPIHFAATIGADVIYNEAESSYMFSKGGQKIPDITEAPTVFKEPAVLDASHIPVLPHYSGAFQMYSKVLDTPSWTCVWYPKFNFVWFSMKNAKKQPITHLWMEFGGRFQYPWNGRTSAVAVEDMCFSMPPEFSARMSGRRSMLAEAGIKTDFKFEKDKTFTLNYLEGGVFVEEDFGKVSDIEFGDGEITLVSETGKRQSAPLNWKYVLE